MHRGFRAGTTTHARVHLGALPPRRADAYLSGGLDEISNFPLVTWAVPSDAGFPTASKANVPTRWCDVSVVTVTLPPPVCAAVEKPCAPLFFVRIATADEVLLSAKEYVPVVAATKDIVMLFVSATSAPTIVTLVS